MTYIRTERLTDKEGGTQDTLKNLTSIHRERLADIQLHIVRYITREQLPYLEDLKSPGSIAKAGGSIQTFTDAC